MPLAGTSAVDKPALDTREATKSSAISPKSNKEVPTREAMAAHYEKYLDVSWIGSLDVHSDLGKADAPESRSTPRSRTTR